MSERTSLVEILETLIDLRVSDGRTSLFLMGDDVRRGLLHACELGHILQHKSVAVVGRRRQLGKASDPKKLRSPSETAHHG